MYDTMSKNSNTIFNKLKKLYTLNIKRLAIKIMCETNLYLSWVSPKNKQKICYFRDFSTNEQEITWIIFVL